MTRTDKVFLTSVLLWIILKLVVFFTQDKADNVLMAIDCGWYVFVSGFLLGRDYVGGKRGQS